MPTNIEDVSTKDLIATLKGETDFTFTEEEIGYELEYRLVPDDDPIETMRGGVRPSHSPI